MSAKGAKNETGTFSPTAKSPIAIDPVPSLTGALRSTRLVSCTRHPEDPPPVPRGIVRQHENSVWTSHHHRRAFPPRPLAREPTPGHSFASRDGVPARRVRRARRARRRSPRRGAHRAPRRGARVFPSLEPPSTPLRLSPSGRVTAFSPSLLHGASPAPPARPSPPPRAPRAATLRASPPAIPDPRASHPHPPPPLRNRLRAFPRPWRTTPRCSCTSDGPAPRASPSSAGSPTSAATPRPWIPRTRRGPARRVSATRSSTPTAT